MYVCLRDMQSSLCVKICTLVASAYVCTFMCRCVFTWPRSVWVFVCLLAYVDMEWRGPCLCPLPVLFCGPPPLSGCEDQLVVGQVGQAQCRVGHHLWKGLFVQLHSHLLWPAPSLPFPNSSEFWWAQGDSGNRMISREWSIEQLVGAAEQWEDSLP